jgi:hypothetical protein
MYQVKVYQRSNAVLIMESDIMESYLEAQKLYLSAGFGEGYWAELHQVYPGYTIMRASTVAARDLVSGR